MKLGENSELVFKNRYALNMDESWESLSKRVGMGGAQVEPDSRKWADIFAHDIYNMLFLPGGRILRNIGRPRGSLFNCYCINVDDTIESIAYSSAKALILWSEGGGVGFNINSLRPEDAPIVQKGGESTGPLSFMNYFNAGAQTIKTGGARRAAALGLMLCDHPDILKYIRAKEEDGVLNNFNISMGVTEKFLEAIETDSEWELKFNQKVWHRIKARDLWNLVSNNMIHNGEPGLINWDNLRSNNSWYFSPVVGTNPCGEAVLSDMEVCDLGSLVLPNFITGSKNTNWQLMEKTVSNAVRFLDNIIQINRYVIDEIRTNAFNSRRIGIGVMGLAEYLFAKKVRYGSKEALQETERLMRNIRDFVYSASVKLAEEKDPFPKFDAVSYSKSHFVRTLPAKIRTDIKKYGIRNVTGLALAPTGCQDKNTMVVTNKGILTLSEIGNINGDKWQDIDLKVSQENYNEEKNAIKFYINGEANTKKIYLKSGNILEATYNHQYRILENGNYIWKRSDEIKIGDDIVSVLNTYNKHTNPDLLQVNITHGNQNNIKKISLMNEKLAEFLGIYFGDGSNHDKGIRINCNANNEEEYGYVAELGEEIFGIKPTFCDNKRNCMLVCFNSQLILNFLEINGLLKQKSKEITIPKIIRQSSRNCINSFIRGFIFADGSKYGNTVFLDTASYNLSKELLVVIRALGNDVRIQENISGLGSKIYRIWIKQGVYKYRPLHEKKKKEQLEKLGLYYCFVDEVINIENSRNYTYDIEVPNTVTYIANSVVSHNTISLLPEVTSSIEPLPWKAYLRHDQISDRAYIHPIYKEIIEEDKEIPDWYVDISDLKPEDHLEMQSICQKYVDGAVSKTINCPAGFQPEQLSDLLLEYIRDLKGVTVYVDGSRDGQILNPLGREEAKRFLESGDVVETQEEVKCASGTCEI